MESVRAERNVIPFPTGSERGEEPRPRRKREVGENSTPDLNRFFRLMSAKPFFHYDKSVDWQGFLVSAEKNCNDIEDWEELRAHLLNLARVYGVPEEKRPELNDHIYDVIDMVRGPLL